MSGHSKWSTIKRQKGAADIKRGNLFTKLSNAITIAVKQGGGIIDPESNFKLRLALARARSANMPKENIERALQRAQGKLEGDLEELFYEGFGPGGVAFVVEVVTDNKQRTVSEIKNVFEKNGGTLGGSGSVSYLFKKRGEIVASKNGFSSDDLLNKGINSRVDDMEETEELIFYYVEPQNLSEAKTKLEAEGLKIESAKIIFSPTSYVDVKEDQKQQVLKLIESLETLDDVQEVYTNVE